MTSYMLLPSEVNGHIRFIDGILPGNPQTLLLPGDVITVSSIILPMKFGSSKKRRRFIIDNLSEDIPFDCQNDEIIFLSTSDAEQGFFIVKRSLWQYWLQLRETLAPEFKNAPLMPDWMLLPVPQHFSEGLSLETGGKVLFRRGRWQGASLPAMPVHLSSVPNRLSLHILPRHRQRFESERHFAVVKNYDVLKKIVEGLNSPGAISIQLTLLFLLNCVLVTGDYALRLQTFPEIQAESYFLPSWFSIQKFSDATPFYLTSVDIHSHELSVSMDSRENCQTLMAQARLFFPQAKFQTHERGNEECSMILTQRTGGTG